MGIRIASLPFSGAQYLRPGGLASRSLSQRSCISRHSGLCPQTEALLACSCTGGLSRFVCLHLRQVCRSAGPWQACGRRNLGLQISRSGAQSLGLEVSMSPRLRGSISIMYILLSGNIYNVLGSRSPGWQACNAAGRSQCAHIPSLPLPVCRRRLRRWPAAVQLHLEAFRSVCGRRLRRCWPAAVPGS